MFFLIELSAVDGLKEQHHQQGLIKQQHHQQAPPLPSSIRLIPLLLPPLPLYVTMYVTCLGTETKTYIFVKHI